MEFWKWPVMWGNTGLSMCLLAYFAGIPSVERAKAPYLNVCSNHSKSCCSKRESWLVPLPIIPKLPAKCILVHVCATNGCRTGCTHNESRGTLRWRLLQSFEFIRCRAVIVCCFQLHKWQRKLIIYWKNWLCDMSDHINRPEGSLLSFFVSSVWPCDEPQRCRPLCLCEAHSRL